MTKITETTTTTTTTSTSTSTSTTSTIPNPTTSVFTFSPQTPLVLQEVFFTSHSVAGSNRRIIRQDWDFGDGESETGSAVAHDYEIAGGYLVTLTVTDDSGQPPVKSFQPITVRALPPAP